MIRVAVLGALGNMGRQVVKAVTADPELELAALVDPVTTSELEGCDLEVMGDVDCLQGRGVDVAVDFTEPAAAFPNIIWLLDNGIHAVVGTTGLAAGQLSRIEVSADEGVANAIIAANFAVGAVLMMKFAEQAAGVFDQCEIIELHHRGKKDAPSGTAITTAERVGEAIKASKVPDPVEGRVTGTRGGSLGDVRIHSVRLDGLVAHQEVIFGSQGQTLTIRHDTTDRSCFMPGVVMAVKAVGRLPGLTLGLEPVLDLQ
jgi:4-hydroxy-tetrahydrodipicolinate reductase